MRTIVRSSAFKKVRNPVDGPICSMLSGTVEADEAYNGGIGKEQTRR